MKEAGKAYGEVCYQVAWGVGQGERERLRKPDGMR
jgi:hypothetical protein